ncbi:integrase [Pseudomonas arsenicoxydans]|uniref:Integrase n=2 Tax=Pseudomonas arsenicoxydans TaxID=702115 RepID=A0A4P6G264_9PSED|nr:integrase [Pseudomonas arsenicoxydans]
MRQLLTTPAYLAAFVSRYNKNINFNKVFKGVLNNLAAIGEQRLGYKVVQTDDLSFGKRESMQHPVIPTRIYVEIINHFGSLLDQVCCGLDRFELFVSSFQDTFYGRSRHYQRHNGVGGKRYFRPSFEQALIDNNLTEAMAGEFFCSNRKQLARSLLLIQYMVKTIIHLYTGMRDQEVLRLRYECLSKETAVAETIDDEGQVRDCAKMINVLSTTTKFEGYRKQESWLAAEEVRKAVLVAQAICRGLVVIYKLDDTKECPLFLNPAILIHEGTEVGVGNVAKHSAALSSHSSMLIQADDLRELALSDPERDFYSEQKFGVGQPWPLSSHQFRRSLAFYASSSGFVSLPSLRSQFKHLTLQMTRYYANGFENLKTIFGYYDSDKKDFVLPASHVALEFQIGMPMSVATQLLADVLGDGTRLFGGTGSYMEKQKARVEKGEVCVEDVRAETINRVKSGELSYRPTLLGGCTKVGRCDSFLLGDFTECLSCDGAIIKPENVDEAIAFTRAEIASYEENSGEYQIAKDDLDKLIGFQIRLINVERFSDEG